MSNWKVDVRPSDKMDYPDGYIEVTVCNTDGGAGTGLNYAPEVWREIVAKVTALLGEGR